MSQAGTEDARLIGEEAERDQDLVTGTIDIDTHLKKDNADLQVVKEEGRVNVRGTMIIDESTSLRKLMFGQDRLSANTNETN